MVTVPVREENDEFCIAVALQPGLLVYWPSWLKALDVKLSRPFGRSGSYTGLIGFNPRQLKGPKRGMSSHAMDLSVYAKSSSYTMSRPIQVAMVTFCAMPIAVLTVQLRKNNRNWQFQMHLLKWVVLKYFRKSQIKTSKKLLRQIFHNVRCQSVSSNISVCRQC